MNVMVKAEQVQRIVLQVLEFAATSRRFFEYLQEPRKDGCHGCLAPATFCDMGATGARFLLVFLNFPNQICYVGMIN